MGENMKGRDKCELLNEIRQKIADENNIEFIIYDCTFEGDCTGTCPKCESELEYLERELEKKQNAGEKINLKNIFTLDEKEEDGSIELVDDVDEIGEIEGMIISEEDELMGDVCPPEEYLEGKIPPNDLDEDY